MELMKRKSKPGLVAVLAQVLLYLFTRSAAINAAAGTNCFAAKKGYKTILKIARVTPAKGQQQTSMTIRRRAPNYWQQACRLDKKFLDRSHEYTLIRIHTFAKQVEYDEGLLRLQVWILYSAGLFIFTRCFFLTLYPLFLSRCSRLMKVKFLQVSWLLFSTWQTLICMPRLRVFLFFASRRKTFSLFFSHQHFFTY